MDAPLPLCSRMCGRLLFAPQTFCSQPNPHFHSLKCQCSRTRFTFNTTVLNFDPAERLEKSCNGAIKHLATCVGDRGGDFSHEVYSRGPRRRVKTAVKNEVKNEVKKGVNLYGYTVIDEGLKMYEGIAHP